MAGSVKNAILKKKIQNTVYDLMIKTTWAMVFADSDEVSLKSYLETLNGDASTAGSYKKYIADTILNEAASSGTLGERVKNAETALAILNNIDPTVAGSLAKVLADAQGYTDTQIGDTTSIDASYTTVVAALNGIKSELEGKISGGFHFKGTKDYTSELPSTAQSEGDVWQVRYQGTSGTTRLDAEYAWNGTEWVEMGSFIDLAPYALSANVTADITAAKENVLGLSAGTAITAQNNVPGQISAAITNERDDTFAGTLAARVKGVEGDVATLNGDSATAGSVDKKILDANGQLPGTVGTTTITTMKSYVDAKAAAAEQAALDASGKFYAQATQPENLTENDLWAQLLD